MSSSVRPRNGMSFNDAVAAERNYQDHKWNGRGSHSWERWQVILDSEVGEVASEIKRLIWESEPSFDGLRSELIQVSAVCAAILEHIEEVREDQ